MTTKKSTRKPRKPSAETSKRIAAGMAVIESACAEPEGAPYVALPLAEVQSVLAQLRELTHVTIDAWACRDAMTDGLEEVLVSLHAARMNLESELTAALGRAGGEP